MYFKTIFSCLAFLKMIVGFVFLYVGNDWDSIWEAFLLKRTFNSMLLLSLVILWFIKFLWGWHIRLTIQNDLLGTLGINVGLVCGDGDWVRKSLFFLQKFPSPEVHDGLMNIIYGDWWRHNQHLLRMGSKRSNSMISASMVHARQVVTVTVITMIIIFMMLILSNSVGEFTNKNYSQL